MQGVIHDLKNLKQESSLNKQKIFQLNKYIIKMAY